MCVPIDLQKIYRFSRNISTNMTTSYYYMSSSCMTTYNENGNKQSKQQININNNGNKDYYYKESIVENGTKKIVNEIGNKNLKYKKVDTPDSKLQRNNFYDKFWDGLPSIGFKNKQNPECSNNDKIEHINHQDTELNIETLAHESESKNQSINDEIDEKVSRTTNN